MGNLLLHRQLKDYTLWVAVSVALLIIICHSLYPAGTDSARYSVPSTTAMPPVTSASSRAASNPKLRQSLPGKPFYIIVPDAWQAMSETDAMEQQLMEEFLHEQGRPAVWLRPGDAQIASLFEDPASEIIFSSAAAPNVMLDEKVIFTFPWGVSRQQAVTRLDRGSIDRLESLTTRQIYLPQSSPAWPVLSALASANPGMDLVALPENMNPGLILQKLASGQYDVVIMESMLLESLMHQYLDLEVVLDVTEDTVMSWAVRAGTGDLQEAINRFVARKQMELNVAETYREDFPQLQQRKVLRLITSQGLVSYYSDNGKLKGFEYELARRFARENRLRLDVIIADSVTEMMTLLQQGRGDMIAAALPVATNDRIDGLVYSRPYNFSAPVVIGREHDSPLLDFRDLENRQIVLPQDSPYIGELERIRRLGVNMEISTASQGTNLEATLRHVSRGDIDLTVVSTHQFNAEVGRHLNLKAHFTLSEPTPHAWAIRNTDSQLLAAMNSFITREYRHSFYNVLYVKYIGKPSLYAGKEEQLSPVNGLSPYDDIVLRYAELYGFDWRLIVAQMYQESRFDPVAVSSAGAAGLMQLIPETAELLGVTDLHDPDTSISGGVRYLDYLRGRFEEDISVDERTWFALAAYNAGYNRVKRARALAETMALDKNRWFNHVEQAMLIMAMPYMKGWGADPLLPLWADCLLCQGDQDALQ